jgi:hypothetical protein
VQEVADVDVGSRTEASTEYTFDPEDLMDLDYELSEEGSTIDDENIQRAKGTHTSKMARTTLGRNGRDVQPQHDEQERSDEMPVDFAERGNMQEDELSRTPSPPPKAMIMKPSEAAWTFALPPNTTAPPLTKPQIHKPTQRTRSRSSITQRRTPSGNLISSLKKPNPGATRLPTRRVSWEATQEPIGDFSEEGTLEEDELESFMEDMEGGLAGAVTGEERDEGEDERDAFGEGFFSEGAGDVGFAIWRDGY